MKLNLFICLILQICMYAQSSDRVSYSADTISFDKPANLVILKGNARAKHKNSVLTASRIILDNNTRVITAHTKVWYTNSVQAVSGRGGRLEYHLQNETVFFYDSPVITSQSNSASVSADLIRYERIPDIVYACTNVCFTEFSGSNHTTITGSNAHYTVHTAVLILKETCAVHNADMNAYGDEITYFQKHKLTHFSGNVSAYMPDAENTEFTNSLFADTVHYSARGDESVYECFKNVKMVQPRDDIIITGQYARHKPSLNYIFVEKEPVLKSGTENFTLMADTFERFESENILYAKGNVVISSEKHTAFGALAVNYLTDKQCVLTGNPRITIEGQTFYAQKINFFIDNKSAIMENQISGSIAESMLSP